MSSIYLTVASLIFAFLCYYCLTTRVKNRELLEAFYDQQQLKNDLAAREKERLDEYNFVLDQSISFIQDIVVQMHKGALTIDGVGFEFQSELAAVVDVLNKTPRNYFSLLIGTYDAEGEGGYNGLSIILEKAPNLRKLRYLELYVIARIMVTQKVQLRNAAILFETNVEVS